MVPIVTDSVKDCIIPTESYTILDIEWPPTSYAFTRGPPESLVESKKPNLSSSSSTRTTSRTLYSRYFA